MRALTAEHLLFIFGTVGGWVHVADEILFVRSPVYGALALAVLNLLAAAAYPRLGRWRAWLAISVGIAWSYGGLATHLIPMLLRGSPRPGDSTGVLVEGPAGLLLLALGSFLLRKTSRQTTGDDG